MVAPCELPRLAFMVAVRFCIEGGKPCCSEVVAETRRIRSCCSWATARNESRLLGPLSRLLPMDSSINNTSTPPAITPIRLINDDSLKKLDNSDFSGGAWGCVMKSYCWSGLAGAALFGSADGADDVTGAGWSPETTA